MWLLMYDKFNLNAMWHKKTMNNSIEKKNNLLLETTLSNAKIKFSRTLKLWQVPINKYYFYLFLWDNKPVK